MWYIELLLTKNGESNPILYCNKKINDMTDVYDWDREMDLCVSVILRPLPTQREGVAMVLQVNLKSIKKTRSKAQAKLLIG